MSKGLFALLFFNVISLHCMELPRIDSPEKAYNFLVNNNSMIEKQTAILHLEILVSLIYDAGYDYISSLFVHPLPSSSSMIRNAHVTKTTELVLNAYSHAIDSFLKRTYPNNTKAAYYFRLQTTRELYDNDAGLLSADVEILNKKYQPVIKALRDLGATRTCNTFPKSISLEHFLFMITCHKSLKDAIAHFCKKSSP